MSRFEGKLLEDSLDFIRIDQFQPKNHNGTVFFLSHFHTDHFKGLFDNAFLKELIKNEEKMLYCTEATKNFISRHRDCFIPERKIKTMTVNHSVPLKHGDRPIVQVTALPAGHCPGSVMFLFEGEATRVLYTGDFRINPDELHKFKALHHGDGSLKKIDRLYLDTTFCDPRYLSFPSRKQSEEDLIEIAKNWLDSKPDHRVGILYNSYHGLEYLLERLASSLKTQINVIDELSYINYLCFPEMHSALCQSDSRVHLCSVRRKDKERKMEICHMCRRDQSNTKIIKPCAMSFDCDQLELGRRKEGINGLVRIAYSLHCSLEELIGTVKYLKPDDVYPCAFPPNVSAEQVLRNLQLDVEKLKEELKEKKERIESARSSSPPTKRFCFSLFPELTEEKDEEEGSAVTDEELHTLVSVCSGDEEENKPLSQNSIDSPPL